jgi:hypothetical protein
VNAGQLLAVLAKLPPETPVVVTYDDAPEYATEVDSDEVLETRRTENGDVFQVLVLTYSQGSDVYTQLDV